MRRLPFERTYLLDYEPCERCQTTGTYAAATPRLTRECWSCRGLGRKITRDGRELFDAVCLLLGASIPEPESRLPVKHLDRITADRIRSGMCVADIHPDRKRPPALVATVEKLPLEYVRLVFADGHVVNAAPYDVFSRVLLPHELDLVDEFLSDYVGLGAVSNATLPDPAHSRSTSPRLPQ